MDNYHTTAFYPMLLILITWICIELHKLGGGADDAKISATSLRPLTFDRYMSRDEPIKHMRMQADACRRIL